MDDLSGACSSLEFRYENQYENKIKQDIYFCKV